MLDSQQIF